LLDVQRTVNRLSDTLGDIPARVSALESARWKLAGACSALSAIFGALGATILNHVLIK